MGRQQNKDPAIVGSSIILLQERFKQLQRLKEMREERQLLKLLPDGCDEAPKLSMDPLALGLNFSPHHMSYYRAIEPQRFPSSMRGRHNSLEETDVDTSLRL